MCDIKTCEKLHKQMWEYIKQNTTSENNTGVDRIIYRMDYKRKFCISKGLDTSDHACVLCKYAKSEEDKMFGSHIEFSKFTCKYCPVDWKSLGVTDNAYMCQSDVIDWRYCDVDDMINLPFKQNLAERE